jgi:hypothetical protein
MKWFKSRTRIIVPLVSIAASVWIAGLPGCASMHAAAPSPPPVSPPPVAPIDIPPPAPPDNSTAETNNDVRPGEASPPPCTCAEVKTKPKPKPKPRPVRKEAPPQLPTAPAVAETPRDGIVDAQVRPLSVSVMSILGKRVEGPKGEDFGRVVDVLADSSGRVRVAIIDFGGFLGVGDRRIAIDWPLLRFNPDGRDPSLLLSLDREQLKVAPEYKNNPRPQTLMEPPAPAPAPAATPPDKK